MKISQQGIDLIKRFEGCKLKSYLCPAGVWTIGYGHTANVRKNQIITSEQASAILMSDLLQFERAVTAMVSVPIKQGQFDALVSFAFNLGSGALASSTLLRKLNSGDFKGAADEFLRWNKAGGKVLEGLSVRRRSERALFVGK
jgi:lysozyme